MSTKTWSTWPGTYLCRFVLDGTESEKDGGGGRGGGPGGNGKGQESKLGLLAAPRANESKR